jgi:hypothetical protein
MKKINLMLIMISGVLLISCGKNTQKESKEKAEEIVINTDCQCVDLNIVTIDADGNKHNNFKDIQKKGSRELYTGTCVEKDQHDSIIRKIEIKNGWIVRQVWKERVNNGYITTGDYFYENTQITDGFEVTVMKGNNGFVYVSSMKEKKNGEFFNEWEINLTKEPYSVSTVYKYKNGKYISEDEQVAPKSMPDSELGESSSINGGRILFSMNEFSMKDISPEQFFRTIEDLKKEFPHFNYWK